MYNELTGNKEFWVSFSFHSCRRHKEKKDDGTEPEADPERDQRTVFAYQVQDISHAYILSLITNSLFTAFCMHITCFYNKQFDRFVLKLMKEMSMSSSQGLARFVHWSLHIFFFIINTV